MTIPSDTFTEKISNLLQANWSSGGTGLASTDILWSHDKFETMNGVELVTQKAIISTYNSQNPVAVEQLSRETRMIHETVVVDLILHTINFGQTDNCTAVREACRQLILQILHLNQAALTGANRMSIEGEYVRGELPEIQREAFKVVVSNFETIPS